MIMINIIPHSVQWVLGDLIKMDKRRMDLWLIQLHMFNILVEKMILVKLKVNK